ncbi:hypothetical protein CC86DRAFT_27964 [Ophiobolus disseminans]|uniref:Uncharacterized protein n=1 Tax=Ophiobolus disseminans TaxID=1469910 RepID=A0A6A6ZZP6_9PLEO|nr:hypothetical protein CC86DRAFT_27964 [Ophiobolus disseminans]
MAPVTCINDLPAELFQQAIGYGVREAGVAEACKTRNVNRAFRDAVTYEIVHYVPLTAFQPIARTMFAFALPDIVSSAVRKAKGSGVAMLLGCEEQVDRVLRIEATTDVEHVKRCYMDDIDTYIKCLPSQIVHKGLDSSHYCYAAGSAQDLIVQMSTAAAVGSLVAVKRYSMDGSPWPSVPRCAVNRLMDDEEIFTNPPRAAASTGKLDIVEYLLEYIDVHFASQPPRANRSLPSLQQQLRSAIGDAIVAKAPKIVNILHNFASIFELGHVYEGCCPSPCAQSWVRSAVKTGCM